MGKNGNIKAPVRVVSRIRNFEHYFNSIDDMIAIIDRDYKILFQNTACKKYHGDYEGEQCYKIFSQFDSVCPDCPSEKVFREGVSTRVELLHSKPFVEIVASPLKDDIGEIIASIEVARDITERKNAELEKENLIRKLEDALAEIKTLRGILPICCYCKKIRDDDGNWRRIEAYVH